MTPRRVALAWLLQHSRDAPIPGTASTQHLDENVAAAGLRLADDELERLDGLLGLRAEDRRNSWRDATPPRRS